MKTILLCLAISFHLIAPVLAATVIVEENFDGVANGTVLGGAQGWNAKWDGGDTTQQNLYTFQGDSLQLDTGVAKRNYHAINSTAITLGASKTITISAEFQYNYTGGGNITENFNKNAFGLLASTTDKWWSGTNKTTSLGNRGGAIGNGLPVSPWVENWITHGSLGVDTTAGGLSDWVRMEYVLTDDGTTVNGLTRIYDVTTGNLLSANPTSYDTGLVSGSTIYAGFSTAWNDVGADVAIEDFSRFSEVNIDNFSVVAVPEPSSAAFLGIVGVGLLLRRRRTCFLSRA